MDIKLEKSHPYNLFITKIKDSEPDSSNDSKFIEFNEIFDKSLGEVKSSLQINFIVDFGWLLRQYEKAELDEKPLLVLHGCDLDELDAFKIMDKTNITPIKIQTPKFGSHHTKMMIIEYMDSSIRIVISTANLYEPDWTNRTQGVWISPKLPLVPGSVKNKDSKTHFQRDLLNYMQSYNIVELLFWVDRIRNCDFRDINVFLVSSVPGFHQADISTSIKWGHPSLGNILREHCLNTEMGSSIVAQCSMIGFLGPSLDAWVDGEFCNSLYNSVVENVDDHDFKLIYPSLKNISECHGGVKGADCFPYSNKANESQPWLADHLYQWKSTKLNLNKAAPHIKSYARLRSNLSWFCLTSHNLSRSAWGAYNTNTNGPKTLRIRNYEAGIVFLPSFVIGEDYFEIDEFPLPYDIPLKKYDADDKPFMQKK